MWNSKIKYYAIFGSHLSYSSLVQAQHLSVKRLHDLQKITQTNVFPTQKCSHRSSFQKRKNFKI